MPGRSNAGPSARAASGASAAATSSQRPRRARMPRRLVLRRREPSCLAQRVDDARRRLVGRLVGGVDVDLGVLRRLVRRVDAGEVLQFAATRLAVQPLHVARLGDRERRVHVHLEELALAEQRTRHAALGAERRDERHQHDQAGVGHQLRHLGDATDVLDSIGVGEAEVAVQAVAHVVAVEQVGVSPERQQLLLDQVRDRRLAGAREAGEPQHRGPLALLGRTRGAVDVERLPVDVLRTPQREVHQSRADRRVGQPVDQDD